MFNWSLLLGFPELVKLFKPLEKSAFLHCAFVRQGLLRAGSFDLLQVLEARRQIGLLGTSVSVLRSLVLMRCRDLEVWVDLPRLVAAQLKLTLNVLFLLAVVLVGEGLLRDVRVGAAVLLVRRAITVVRGLVLVAGTVAVVSALRQVPAQVVRLLGRSLFFSWKGLGGEVHRILSLLSMPAPIGHRAPVVVTALRPVPCVVRREVARLPPLLVRPGFECSLFVEPLSRSGSSEGRVGTVVPLVLGVPRLELLARGLKPRRRVATLRASALFGLKSSK